MSYRICAKADIRGGVTKITKRFTNQVPANTIKIAPSIYECIDCLVWLGWFWEFLKRFNEKKPSNVYIVLKKIVRTKIIKINCKYGHALVLPMRQFSGSSPVDSKRILATWTRSLTPSTPLGLRILQLHLVDVAIGYNTRMIVWVGKEKNIVKLKILRYSSLYSRKMKRPIR